MNIAFKPVQMDEIPQLAAMADEIWHEYWPALIGAAQTDYMVEKFQSEKALTTDLAEHDYEYWFIEVHQNETPEELAEKRPDIGRAVGYVGGRVEAKTNRFFLSKLYLFERDRGQGYASATIRFLDQLCRDRHLKGMYLTVNKGNDLAIRAYKGNGFETIDAVETDIGHGFVMDDYIMFRACS